MRIISGSLKGRKFNPPKDLPVRPTTDYGKEGLFSLLDNRYDFENCNVLDLYSGTGNMAYEFASRGAKQVTAVDLDYKCTSYIKQVSKGWDIKTIRVFRSDVSRFIERRKESYDIIYADPPYEIRNLGKRLDHILMSGIISKDGILVFEHSKRNDFSKKEQFLEERKYGDVRMSIFSA